MRNIKTIAFHEFIVNLRRPSFILLTLLPFFMALFISFVTSHQLKKHEETESSREKQLTGIIDHSHLIVPISEKYSKSYLSYPDEDSAKKDLLADKIQDYAVIPQDFLKEGKATVYTLEKEEHNGVELRNIKEPPHFQTFLSYELVEGKLNPDMIPRVIYRADTKIISLNKEGVVAPQGVSQIARFIAPLITVALLSISIFTGSGFVLQGIAEEKESCIIEVLLSSVTTTELFIGKIIGLATLGIIQIGVWLLGIAVISFGASAFITGIAAFLNPGLFLLCIIYYMLGYLLTAILMAVCGSIGSTRIQSQQLSTLFVIPMLLPLVFIHDFSETLNSPLVRILSWFPLTSPSTMMIRLPLLTEFPTTDVIISITALLITIPAAAWFGVRIFRAGILLNGQTLSFKKIIQAMLSSN
jgi:ABC-2 type transport system permease protein